MNGFVIKQGNSFRLAALIREYDGTVLDLSGCTFSCQLRDVLGNVLADLSALAVQDRMGIVQVTYTGSTAAWPVGRYRGDLRTVWPDGTIQSSQTFAVTVIAGVTTPDTGNAT